MAYTPKVWADGSGGGTPITAAELNRMETGIEDADTRLDALALSTQESLDTKKNIGDTTSLAELPAGATFTRRYASGAWPLRGSNRSDIICIWVSATAGVIDPPERVAGVDLLLEAQA